MSKMQKYTVAVILACTIIFDWSNSAFIDTLPKCSIKDNECQRQLFQDTLQKIGKSGIPDLNVPPIDPIHLENVSVSVLNLVNITLLDGEATGIKDCTFKKFIADIDKEIGRQEILCDITIKGHYLLDAASPLIESVLGGSSIHGEGNGKIAIKKLLIEFVFPFYAQRRDDGEIYITCDYKEIKNSFDVLGKVTFSADKIYLGKEDVSEFVVGYMNENWKFLMKSFGQIFIDKAADYYFKFAGNFFDLVPAKYYISDDLTPYLKN
ncbi:unnamed protein product [Parnassius apollo]|uniref:(apollo) hypothetical protein n=1 Tax=Parnassius apollo TaxID=110799 RepID=A0A8S3XMJ6_PARAO|nr:unnamed protein product [Parnassius apollo]